MIRPRGRRIRRPHIRRPCILTFDQRLQVTPAPIPARVVQTAGQHRTVGLQDDVRAAPVRRVPGALRKLPPPRAVAAPRPLLAHGQPVPLDPPPQVEFLKRSVVRARPHPSTPGYRPPLRMLGQPFARRSPASILSGAGRQFARRSRRTLRRTLQQRLHRHGPQLRRRLEDPRHPVRPLRRVIPLARHRPVQLPDARRVEHLPIHRHPRVVEAPGQRVKHAGDQPILTVPVKGQVHPVQQMRAIPRVRQHGLGPLQARQVLPDLARALQGQGVLLLRRRNSRRTHRVAIDRQPPPRGHIQVARQRILCAHVHHVVLGPRQQRGQHRVQRHVDSACLQPRRGRSQLLPVVEVPRHGMRLPPSGGLTLQCPQLHHLPDPKQHPARPQHLRVVTEQAHSASPLLRRYKALKPNMNSCSIILRITTLSRFFCDILEAWEIFGLCATIGPDVRTRWRKRDQA